MFKNIHEKISIFNDYVAVKGVNIFGTMTMTYLFFLYGFLPLFIPEQQENLLYISNTVQLWSLPLIIVGQNLLGRDSERRANETHDAVMLELKMIKEFIDINNTNK